MNPRNLLLHVVLRAVLMDRLATVSIITRAMADWESAIKLLGDAVTYTCPSALPDLDYGTAKLLLRTVREEVAHQFDLIGLDYEIAVEASVQIVRTKGGGNFKERVAMTLLDILNGKEILM